jgi:hypothetical protein
MKWSQEFTGLMQCVKPGRYVCHIPPILNFESAAGAVIQVEWKYYQSPLTPPPLLAGSILIAEDEQSPFMNVPCEMTPQKTRDIGSASTPSLQYTFQHPLK